MLSEIKKELQENVYPEDDIECLNQLKSVSKIEYGVFSSNIMRAFLSKEKLYIELKELANRTHSVYTDPNFISMYDTIHNASSATLDTINTGQPFDYSDEYVRLGVGLYSTIGFFTPEQYQECLNLGATVVHPFEKATLRLVKQARNKSLPAKTIQWNNEKYLKITTHSDTFEPVRPYITKSKQNLWNNEPVGRTTSKPIEKAGEYIVNLTGVQDSGTINVYLDITSDFSLEVL